MTASRLWIVYYWLQLTVIIDSVLGICRSRVGFPVIFWQISLLRASASLSLSVVESLLSTCCDDHSSTVIEGNALELTSATAAGVAGDVGNISLVSARTASHQRFSFFACARAWARSCKLTYTENWFGVSMQGLEFCRVWVSKPSTLNPNPKP